MKVTGRCSVCHIRMKVVGDAANPISRTVTNRNPHRHNKVWKIIIDEADEGYRYWHDYAPNIVTN